MTLPTLLSTPKTKSPSSWNAWAVISVFVLMTLGLLIAGAGGVKILAIAFPFGSFLVGWFLYFRYPPLYIGFVWWILFVTAFVRRYADFRGGAFTDPSPILLAPYAAIVVCGHTLYFNLPKVREQGSAPFVLVFTSMLYGYLVGVIKNSPILATIKGLEWITPLLFGYHLYVHWYRYPEYGRHLRKVFLWGVILMGSYGIYQYLVAPDWDRLWLVSSKMITSGLPIPQGMRVWSTMNSPAPFGDYMATGLLLLLSSRNILVVPASAVGFLSFLLCMVRTAWLGWILGMFSLVVSLPHKQKIQILVTILVLAAIVIPLSTVEPFATTIGKRLQTLSDISTDNSANERQIAFGLLINDAISELIGKGFGGFDTDSAFLVLMIELGWFGAITYVSGFALCVFLVLTFKSKNDDVFLSTIQAILIKSLFFLLSAPTMRGAHGVMLWSSIGIALAGRKYHQIIDQRNAAIANQVMVDTDELTNKSAHRL
jgi:hypothetical protein